VFFLFRFAKRNAPQPWGRKDAFQSGLPSSAVKKSMAGCGSLFAALIWGSSFWKT